MISELMKGLAAAALLGAGVAMAQDAQPVPVTVEKVATQEIADTLDVVGRVQAIQRVDVQARVDGYLDEVVFTEGSLVTQGDVLYRIEPDLFEAAVTQAKGELARSEAQQAYAKIELDRAQRLMERDVGTVEARDQAKANYDSATADVMVNQGKLRTAETNLGYTTITAPISGRIGRTQVTRGNVVGPSSGVLTTIVSEDPIYALFPVSDTTVRTVRERGGEDRSKIKVRLRFSDGSEYAQVGQIDFVDVTVDRSTDTVMVRAIFPNPDRFLQDGQLVQVLISSGTPESRTVVAQSAVMADQGGLFVFVVEDGKATRRTVRLGKADGADVVVQDGLSPGDLVITEGLERLRPGMPVLAQPAADGKS